MPLFERKGKPAIHYHLDDFTDPWKNAPYLILQHGFARNANFFYSWVPYLSRFYKVVRTDLRGLGKSGRDFDMQKDIGLPAFIDDMNGLIDHLGAQSVHYCGESLGGMLGMGFAAECPQRIRTLSAVSSPVHLIGPDNAKSSFGYSSRIEAMRAMGVRAWAEASTTGRRFPPDADPGLIRWCADEMGQSDVEVLAALYAWASTYDTTPYLPRIKAPFLGLFPSAGPITTDEHLDTLKAKIPNSTIVRIPCQYHTVSNLEPAACALTLLQFAGQFDGIACHE